MGCARRQCSGKPPRGRMNTVIFLGNFMIRRLLALSVACASLSAPVLAADLIVASDEVAVASDGFDWARPYIGAELAGEFPLFDDGDTYLGGGIFAGVNVLVTDNVLLGIQGTADLVSDGDETWAELFVLGRAGVLVTPDVLLYGVAGFGYEFDIEETEDNGAAYQLGAGIEFAVTEDVTLRGQLTGYGSFDGDDLFDYARATVGVAFHF